MAIGYFRKPVDGRALLDSIRWALSYNKTWDMGGGHGLDFVTGPYYNIVRPDGAARWQINFSINWLFP